MKIVLVKKIFVVFLIFIYIYNIKFIFLPITSRQLLAILGGFYALQINKRYILKYVNKPLILFSLLSFVTLCSSLYNQQPVVGVFSFMLFSFAGNFLACLFIVKLIDFKKYEIYYLVTLIIYAIFLHNLIVFIIYLNPNFKFFIFSVIQNSYNIITDIDIYHSIFNRRLIGLGAGSLFGGGVISSIGLLLCSYTILVNSRLKSNILFILIYVFIFFTGLFISRTTLVGLFLSIIYVIIVQRKFKPMQMIKILFIVTFTCIIAFHFFLKTYNEDMLKWAFEFYFRYLNTGIFSTSSSDQLFDMIVFPSNFKTYLLGDSLYSLSDGSYYKNIDMGYLRMLYAIGLIGMLILVYIHYYLINIIIEFNSKFKNVLYNKTLFIMLFFVFLITNIKGFSAQYFFYSFFIAKMVICSDQNIKIGLGRGVMKIGPKWTNGTRFQSF